MVTMKKMRFPRMFLGLLLVVSCIKDPLAEARRQGSIVNAEVTQPIQEDTAGGLAAAAGTRRMVSAGRKTVVDRALTEGSSQVSGTPADLSDIKKSRDDEPKASKYARTLGKPTREESLKWDRPPRTRITTTAIDDEPSSSSSSSSSYSSSQVKEKTLHHQLEAAVEEVVNLLHRDYSRGPPKARRKPPIHNREPFN